MTKGEIFAMGIAAALALSIVMAPTPAKPIRLIGECNGLFYGGMEEDEFPDGCAWIEPIRYDVR